MRSAAWPDKSERDRHLWATQHLDEVAEARASLYLAVDHYARVLERAGAVESVCFNRRGYADGVMSAADSALASEVRQWMEAS